MSRPTLASLLVCATALAGFSQDQPLSDQVQALIRTGDHAKAKGDLTSAEQSLRNAVKLARQMPQGNWLMKAEALEHLSLVYHDLQRTDDAEELLRERVEVIRAAAPLDPALGIALFELQSAHAAGAKLDLALEVAKEATAYYTGPCSQSLSSAVCDRRLADVEGLMGAAYANASRLDEAEPWLKKVVDRSDDGVRPEIMLVALRVYTTILYSRLNLVSALLFHRRTLEFQNTHPTATRNLGRWANEPPKPGTSPN